MWGHVHLYDPLNEREMSIPVDSRSGDTVTVTLDAVDYPYLLVLDEGAET